MNRPARRLLLWAPRILGVLVALFLGMFALDAFSEGKPFARALPEFLIHLAPALALLLVVAVSWRWEWVGGVAFVVLAAAYSLAARTRIDWILTIAGPLLVVGVLFLVSWYHRKELHAEDTTMRPR